MPYFLVPVSADRDKCFIIADQYKTILKQGVSASASADTTPREEGWVERHVGVCVGSSQTPHCIKCYLGLYYPASFVSNGVKNGGATVSRPKIVHGG